MFGQIVGMLHNALAWGVTWFLVVLENAGMTSYYLAAIFLLLLARFLLYPLFRSSISSGASDTVRKNKKV